MLNSSNYDKGFLIDDEAIGGVTSMAGGIFAAYVTHYLTSETLNYREFDSLQPALDFLNGIERKWIYESVGCSKGSKSGGAKTLNMGASACGTSGGCGPCGCK